MDRLQEQGIRSVGQFFQFFLWLVASLFVDLVGALLLTGYGTSMGIFWGPLIFLLQGSKLSLGLGMSTICHLTPDSPRPNYSGHFQSKSLKTKR
jgi:hypothetical protein